jgi:trimeric autotransporter adhesin
MRRAIVCVFQCAFVFFLVTTIPRTENFMTTNPPPSASRRLLVLLLAVVSVNSVSATTYCVDTPALLESALVQVTTHSNDSDIRIVSGTYELDGLNLDMGDIAVGNLAISGGWSDGCAQRISNDSRLTVLAGSTTQSFQLVGGRGIDMRALSFYKFAIVRTRRKGDIGGYNVNWDGVQLDTVSAIDTSSESAGAIDLRNVIVHDSGSAISDCMWTIAQEVNDGFSTTLLAHSTFALNQGNKQVCLIGVETQKLVRNNIFDGDALQQSVFVASTEATLQRNRVQTLGGLPPSAVSTDNFTTAPGFIDVAVRDFRLAAGSPAINRGFMVLPGGQGQYDVFGKIRWTGFRPDLGALESGVVESSVFMVTNANDSGPGSLRQAVIDANANADASIIQFDIPNACGNRILLVSQLPVVTGPLWVSGYSQPGSAPNASDTSFDAQLCVTLVAGQNEFAHAFRTQSSGSSMRIEGVAFGGFTASVGNNATIALGDVNESVIRGNQFGGISNVGTLPPSNTDISIAGTTHDAQIGGPLLSDRNLFSRALVEANVAIGSLARGTQVMGNWFGMHRDGGAVLAADVAIAIEGADSSLRGNRFVQGSVGIMLSANSSERNRIQGNIFGLDAHGASAPMQVAVSVRGGKNNIIGAVANQETGGNVIDGSTSAAIRIFTTNATPLSARVRGNSIHDSVGHMDIDLAAAGPTLNDAGDADEGPNRTMNHPVLASVTDTNSFFSIAGSIDTKPGSILIDIYGSYRCTAGLRGDSLHHLASVSTSNGQFALQMPLNIDNPYPFISATATDSDGNTGELSTCLRAPSIFEGGFE